ncbi:MAG: hypothetical protein IJY01_00120 [Clostridia bacterium]|nr:hypothetical protein [Clostridia bacterium]
MASLVHLRAEDGSIIRLEYHETCPSVAELARRYAIAGYPDRYVVVSERQTKVDACGRPLKADKEEVGVYISLILRPSMFPSQAGFFSAMSTVALITALDEHTTKRLGIGWVSDIFCEGERIGGVTVEGRLDNFSSYEYIIVSFSVRLTEGQFPPRISDLIKKVFGSENASVSMIIAKDILSKFFVLYPRLKDTEKFMDVYKDRFILAGKRVSFLEYGKRRRCKILNVDNSDCSLIVETKGGLVKRIYSPKNVFIPKIIR